MKKPLLILPFITIAYLLQNCTPTTSNQVNPDSSGQLVTSNKPNIIYILADDLGYGELGSYGQELIETPNLDALAKAEGVTVVTNPK